MSSRRQIFNRPCASRRPASSGWIAGIILGLVTIGTATMLRQALADPAYWYCFPEQGAGADLVWAYYAGPNVPLDSLNYKSVPINGNPADGTCVQFGAAAPVVIWNKGTGPGGYSFKISTTGDPANIDLTGSANVLWPAGVLVATPSDVSLWANYTLAVYKQAIAFWVPPVVKVVGESGDAPNGIAVAPPVVTAEASFANLGDSITVALKRDLANNAIWIYVDGASTTPVNLRTYSTVDPTYHYITSPGEHVRYDLQGNFVSAGSGPVAVGAGSPSAFGMRCLGNPARSTGVEVLFDLSTPGPAELELFDVAGRRVAERPLGVLSPGTHRASLGGPGLETGVYLVKLTQRGRLGFAKAVVTR